MGERQKVFRSERLREVRAKNHTQEEFAALIGIKQSQYARYENGLSEPSSKVMSDIANALNVTTDYLLGQSDDPNPSISEEDLSADELALLNAYRSGRLDDLLQIVVEARRHNQSDESTVPSSSKN